MKNYCESCLDICGVFVNPPISDMAHLNGFKPTHSRYLLSYTILLSLIDRAYHKAVSLSVHMEAYLIFAKPKGNFISAKTFL